MVSGTHQRFSKYLSGIESCLPLERIGNLGQLNL